MLAAWLVAGAGLGALDAALAAWSNRAVAPGSTLPLCLTAPFVVGLIALAPVALATAAGSHREGPSFAGALATLLGVATALAALRAADALGAARPGVVPLAGDRRVALLLALGALGAGVLGRRALRVRLCRLGPRAIARLVALAIALHATALGGLAWQLRRESRGLLGDLLGVEPPWITPDATAAARTAARAGGAPRNLVLVTLDALRADLLDRARMPRTSAFAASAARFDAAFASSSWTLPAVATILTGLPAAAHGAGLPLGVDPLARSPLPPGTATVATVLHEAGFATRAIVTNPYLGLGYGLGQGFDAFENVTIESEAVLTLRPTVGFWLLAQLWPALDVADRGGAVTRRAARFLDGGGARRPFFLWLHYVDAHAPYAGTTRSFRDDLLAGGTDGATLPRMAELRAGEIRPDAAGRAALRAAYARAVRALDGDVGTVLDLLDRNALADDTLVVVTADHGEEFWDHGGVEHGHTLYGELVRVPLALRCPGCAPAGARIGRSVGLEGLAATLLDLLGVVPRDAAGPLGRARSLAPLLRGEPFAPRPVVSENLLFAEERVALRDDRYTYVAWPNGKEELYDRRRDPRELTDLAARRGLLARERALLASLRAGPAGAPAAGSRGGAQPGAAARDAGSAADARAVTRRALRALGYVE